MAGEDDTYVQETLIKMCETVAADVQRPLDPSSTLAELGLDSLACADLALAVEDQFGVRLADADVTSLNTVRQIARVVKGKITSRSRIPPGLGRLQRPVVVLGGWAFRWQSRLEIHGAGHMPMRGPVLIAANHRSLLDTPLVALACPRPITFMAKQELFSNRFLARFFHEVGGFSVRRDIGDIRSIDIGLAVLEQGEVLGMYPEGKRSKTDRMLPFLDGAAWMALCTGAPIVPCGVRGTERPSARPRSLRKRVRVSFGPAIAVERVTDAATRRRMAHRVSGALLESVRTLLA